MSWINKLFSSSLGQKLIMAITGLFLISFLVVHATLNSFIFINDGGHLFNEGAEFMGTNPVIRTMEIVLFIGLLLHIIKGLSLWSQNNQARPVKYAVVDGKANSKWYSRSMGLLGTLLLMFLIVHLRHFWYESRLTDRITGGETTLFAEMSLVFENVWVVILYVLAMVSLSYHLMHGFQSAFQSLGMNHKKYTPMIKGVGFWFSIIVPLVFALMPVVMYLGFIK
jgi:succinate dehydrogenase / fumarate reductase cytochrome b subunit